MSRDHHHSYDSAFIALTTTTITALLLDAAIVVASFHVRQSWRLSNCSVEQQLLLLLLMVQPNCSVRNRTCS